MKMREKRSSQPWKSTPTRTVQIIREISQSVAAVTRNLDLTESMLRN